MPAKALHQKALKWKSTIDTSPTTPPSSWPLLWGYRKSALQAEPAAAAPGIAQTAAMLLAALTFAYMAA